MRLMILTIGLGLSMLLAATANPLRAQAADEFVRPWIMLDGGFIEHVRRCEGCPTDELMPTVSRELQIPTIAFTAGVALTRRVSIGGQLGAGIGCVPMGDTCRQTTQAMVLARYAPPGMAVQGLVGRVRQRDIGGSEIEVRPAAAAGVGVMWSLPPESPVSITLSGEWLVTSASRYENSSSRVGNAGRYGASMLTMRAGIGILPYQRRRGLNSSQPPASGRSP